MVRITPSNSAVVTPEDVLRFEQPTLGYLCPLQANVVGVEFIRFQIKDYKSGAMVYQSGQAPSEEPGTPSSQEEIEHMMRSVKYKFPTEFLEYETVRTLLEFKVGPQPVKDFEMIELHFFKNKLVRTFRFQFGFVIPSSVNTWEAIYDMPKYSPAMKEDYISNPFAHTSDSFYFVDGRLIMHNKAAYAYVPTAN